jgi:ADP-heptose:LPS heptosyltransferase
MNIAAKPWTGPDTPKRILAIRLQAMGDVVITLPYLQQLRRSLPRSVRFDLLTRRETEDIPKNIQLFDNVFSIGGGRNHKRQLVDTFFLLPKLWMQGYDMVIDLQNTLISKIVRKTIRPKAWSEFDKYSPLAAGERNRLSIEAAGLGKNDMDTQFGLKHPGKATAMLKENGWNEGDKLIVLNPAGFFETRNWPLQNFVDFAGLWLQQFPHSKFIVLGTSFVGKKASFLQQQVGDRLINLTGQTVASDAFAILQHASLVISEDSGLMHMSWVSGIPTIALFGSTRSDWSRPLGPHSYFFDSSDLACGNCMGTVCRMGDTRCLTRVTPEMVLQQALILVGGRET